MNKFTFKISMLCIVSLYMCLQYYVNAYELGTHSRITQEALHKSQLLSGNSVLQDYNLSINEFLDIHYFKVENNNINKKTASTFVFEEGRFPPLNTDQYFSLEGWIMRGSVREDDWLHVKIPGCTMISPHPQDGGVDRPLNHFFDPYFNKPLTILGIEKGKKAIDWALGTVDAQVLPSIDIVEDDQRKNHFSVLDAREAQYRALTGQTIFGDKNIGPGNTPPSDLPGLMNLKQIRSAYWATMFRTLGNVMHLVEDMAQPQHTRNDPHSGACGSIIQAHLSGYTSFYEKYIESRAVGKNEVELTDSGIARKLKNLKPLTYDGYPIPDFSDLPSIFTTSNMDADVLNRKGLADFSNRSFFTAGTNLGNNLYDFPSNSISDYTQSSVELGYRLGYKINFLTDVHDSLYPVMSKNKVPITTKSAWADKLPPIEGTRFFTTLEVDNYDAMASMLIPRAVGYSAGLINYFFRSRIALIREPGQTIETRRFLIRNYHETERMNGRFELYYDSSDGTRKRLNMYDPADIARDTPLINFNVPANGQSRVITFDAPTDFDPDRTRIYTLVFRGVMGNEVDAVAGKEVCLPIDIAAGGKANYFINCDYTLWAWGSNGTFGELNYALGRAYTRDGLDLLIATAAPVPINPPLDIEQAAIFSSEKFIKVFGGFDSATGFALAESGNFWGWGDNDSAQLGDGTQDTIPRARLLGNNILAASTNNSRSLFLVNTGNPDNPDEREIQYSTSLDGTLSRKPIYWALKPEIAQPPEKFIDVQHGTSYGAALSEAGNVYLWNDSGYDIDFNLAKSIFNQNLDSDINDEIGTYIPTKIARNTGLPQIKEIAAGTNHLLALDTAGQVWAWGRNDYGQLGPDGGVSTSKEVPVKVTGLPVVKSISAGNRLSVALGIDGRVYVWGDRWYGQRGDDIPGVYAGYRSYSGPSYSDTCHQSAPNIPPGPNSKISCGLSDPVAVPGVERIIKVVTDGGHILALREDGVMLSWGWNYLGESGGGECADGACTFFNPTYTPKPFLVKATNP